MLSAKERRLAAHMLRRAAEEFSNHGCNDLDGETLAAPGFTDEEKVAFVREYIGYNGDPTMYGGIDKVTPKHFGYLMDWMLMHFLADKLESE